MKLDIRSAVLVLLTAAGACAAGEAEEPTFRTAAVEHGNVRLTAEAVGNVEPVRRVEVKSMASGEVLRLHVAVGDVVQPGALLAEIDPRDVRNRYDQAEADLEVAEAQERNARASLERSRELHAARVITDQELESARLSLTNSEANLTRARTNLELARLQLDDVIIRAPMAGTIIQKSVEEGTVIQSAAQNVSGGTALFVMANLQEMQVRTLVDESDIGQLHPGLPTTVRVQAHPDVRFEGAVYQVEPQAVVERNVTKFPVIVTVDNRDGLLRPGMNAEVQILIDEATGVLLLDNTALVSPQNLLPAALALGLDESAVDMARLAAGTGAGRWAQGARTGGGGAAPGGGHGGRGGAIAGGLAGTFGSHAPEGREGRARETRRMVVFVAGPRGALIPRLVEIGLDDWSHTEIVSGLEEGERVALVSAAQLQAQQQALLSRMGSGHNPFGVRLPGGGFGGH